MMAGTASVPAVPPPQSAGKFREIIADRKVPVFEDFSNGVLFACSGGKI
jgi:hypothetical protein